MMTNIEGSEQNGVYVYTVVVFAMMKVFSVRQSVKSGFPLQIPLIAQ